jgi:VWFA-related protein
MFTPSLSFSVLAAALCLVALRMPGLAQGPSPQSAQPTFRSTVDLLTIDISVRDKSGQPVTDLQPSDFTVTIDGRPRKVVSVVFYKADTAARARLSGGAAPTPQYTANDRTQPGRVIVFALDAETIRGDQERALFDTVSRMVEVLSPGDAVGTVEIPGPSSGVTRDHRPVVEGLKRFRGRAPAEMEKIAAGRDPALMAATERAHSQQLLMNLATVVREMGKVRAPRSLILISGGRTFDLELLAQYKELARAAAEARVTLYTVFLDPVGYDVSRGLTRPEVADDPALSEGLATMASMTGGMFFSGIARAAGVFDRIQSEVTSFYQLALESSPADADGKQHDVKVKVNRTGLDVRAPAHVAIAKPPKSAPLRDLLAEALQEPTDVPDVPLAVSTYSTHAAGGAIQVLLSAEIGAPDAAAPAEWGFAVSQRGKDAVIRRGRIPAGSARPHMVSTTMELPPGDYRLRTAAVDAEGRVGVLETPFRAGYQMAGATVMFDLVLGAMTAGEFEPRRRLARTEEVVATLQVLANAGTVSSGLLQLVPAGSARSVLSIPLSMRPSSSAGGPATLQARASLAAVPAGRYTASAVLEITGHPITRIDRVIEVTGVQPVTAPVNVVTVPVTNSPPATAPSPPPPAASTAPPVAGSPDEIMRRVGAYVENYGGQASLLVGVEQYSQSQNRREVALPGTRVGMRGMAGNAPIDGVEFGSAYAQKRRLVSEFALVPNASASGGWLGFRDVIEVDGKPITNRSDRLQALFQAGAPDLTAARRIADEGARYNIGAVSRNFNVPTTTLFFFPPRNLSRFTFRRKGRERIDGVETAVIDFYEERSPTLTMTSSGADVPASGTLWVNPADGAVVRTRLEFRGFDNAGSRAVVDVSYRKDPALGMWVPSRMTERYSAGSGDTATTVATYGAFKRFQTSVKIK